jgi:hypothetical protein
MSIVITGTSGRLGRLTTELVLDLVPDPEVILTTHRPEAHSDCPPRSLRTASEDHRGELPQEASA